MKNIIEILKWICFVEEPKRRKYTYGNDLIKVETSKNDRIVKKYSYLND